MFARATATRKSRPTGAALGDRRGLFVERTVTTSDGVRLAVRDYGSAAADHTVVLLHGLLLTQDSWEIQVRRLVRQWGECVRVITYDHRGHGRSSGAAMSTYRIDRLAADLAEVLKELRVSGPLTLAGHSMGGMTALAYLGRPAAERPVEPTGLVLVATAAGRIAERGIGRLLTTPVPGMLSGLAGRMPRETADRAINAVVGPARDALVMLAGRAGVESGGFAVIATECTRSISLATAAGFLEGIKRYDQYESLGSIAAKTVVVSGGADTTTPVAHSHDLAAAIPGATHVHRPTAGHMLLQEDPESVSAAIEQVMARRRGTAHAAGAPEPLRTSATRPLSAAAS